MDGGGRSGTRGVGCPLTGTQQPDAVNLRRCEPETGRARGWVGGIEVKGGRQESLK